MARLPLRQGLDFSTEPPGSAAIKAIGRDFVVRYAARDWRGLKAYELADYRANGIDVAMVYESTEGRVKEGYVAGAFDATYAHNFLVEMGMSNLMPIYFAVDYPLQPGDVPALYQYLQGADDAIGAARVGIYGGFAAIDAAAKTGVKWLWQTSAWSSSLHPQALLYQHEYNFYVLATNCDKTDAYAANFGQESLFGSNDGEETVPSPPTFPKPDLPDFYDRVNGQRHPAIFVYKNRKYYPVRAMVKALDTTLMRVKPSRDAKRAGDDIPVGQKIPVDWVVQDADKHLWLVNGNGYYYGAKFSPRLQLSVKRDGQVVELVP
jgi:hypothetical protein